MHRVLHSPSSRTTATTTAMPKHGAPGSAPVPNPSRTRPAARHSQRTALQHASVQVKRSQPVELPELGSLGSLGYLYLTFQHTLTSDGSFMQFPLQRLPENKQTQATGGTSCKGRSSISKNDLVLAHKEPKEQSKTIRNSPKQSFTSMHLLPSP